jgi:hypothetical protein
LAGRAWYRYRGDGVYGAYWIPAFEVLEEHGLEALWVGARAVKNVPGRKTDVLDCQWLQQLHTYGLPPEAFRPPQAIFAAEADDRVSRGALLEAADQQLLVDDGNWQRGLAALVGFVAVRVVLMRRIRHQLAVARSASRGRSS